MGCIGDSEPQVSAPEPVLDPTSDEIAVNEEWHKRREAGYIQLLKDKNLNFWRRADEALEELEDLSAVEPIIEALRDPFVDIWWLAAKSLGKSTTPGRSDPFRRRSSLKISGSGSGLRGGRENSVIRVRSNH